MNVVLFIVAGLALWLAAAVLTASYGQKKGFPFVPLFLCALGLGSPLVLLAVTIAGGPDRQ